MVRKGFTAEQIIKLAEKTTRVPSSIVATLVEKWYKYWEQVTILKLSFSKSC